jgi:hypothetical protein
MTGWRVWQVVALAVVLPPILRLRSLRSFLFAMSYEQALTSLRMTTDGGRLTADD